MKDVVIGLDLGGTKILAAAVKPDGTMLSRIMELTPVDDGPDAVLACMASLVERAIAEAGIDRETVAGVGIGSPGPLDMEAGVVICSPNLPGWDHVPMKERIASQTGLPVIVDNDANVGVLGEFTLGAGRDAKSVVGLFVGTGVGGGVILDGQLLHGFSGQAGELGHIVIDYGGPKCGCGQRGCLEAYASRQVICRNIAEAVKAGKKTVITETKARSITTPMISEALRAGDRVVTKAVKKAMRFLGIGIASIAHVVSPEMFIIGGGIVDALDDDMMAYIVKVASNRALAGVMDNVRIVKAQLGEDAAVLGAAALAQKAFSIIP